MKKLIVYFKKGREFQHKMKLIILLYEKYTHLSDLYYIFYFYSINI